MSLENEQLELFEKGYKSKLPERDIPKKEKPKIKEDKPKRKPRDESPIIEPEVLLNVLVAKANAAKQIERIRSEKEEREQKRKERKERQKYFVDKKIIISGPVVEVIEYEKPYFVGATVEHGKGHGLGGRGKASEDTTEDDKREIRYKTLKETQKNVRRLINANFRHNSKFVTFTFKENVQDVGEANEYWHKFIKRMRRKYGGFRYVAVIEFQERGAIHYHMICDLPYIPNEHLRLIWQNYKITHKRKGDTPFWCVGEQSEEEKGYAGWVRINQIKGYGDQNCDNVGAYVTAYMTEDIDDERLRGKKTYNSSHNLLKPTEYREPNEVYRMEQVLKLDKKNTVQATSYDTEYLGVITYKQFNIERDHAQFEKYRNTKDI